MQHSFFFFNDTATTEIYTLSLHDALPILFRTFKSLRLKPGQAKTLKFKMPMLPDVPAGQYHLSVILDPENAIAEKSEQDRKSTRLNSSHANISYAVFCLKKKKTI